ncbi:hypothetical protein T07_13807 [Trichinella nelsoni]|uniref:Uncharacterized protein n=1 Tax=Trichinella nelsoni TaxID=6336 RepID=A0A0V0RT96_9BILA|nr:hypothetical protein T07_13807 [Trichinella nelsoni]
MESVFSKFSIVTDNDVRLAMAMRNKSASERKCTSRIAIKVPYCQLMCICSFDLRGSVVKKFKEWSKETVITRATWSKSWTSRSKIREQVYIVQTLSLNSVRVSWGYFKRVKLYFNSIKLSKIVIFKTRIFNAHNRISGQIPDQKFSAEMTLGGSVRSTLDGPDDLF